jgi:hypothetical protein
VTANPPGTTPGIGRKNRRRTMKMRTAFLFSLIPALASALLVGKAFGDGAEARTQVTDHYRIALEIGPLTTMLMPDLASGAKEGEVIVGMSGIPMRPMDVMNDGQPVNRHLEVHIHDKATGTVLSTPLPMIVLTDQENGKSRSAPTLTPMYDVKTGPQDLHFGQSLYLPAGVYTVTVAVRGERATFKNISLGNP